MLVDWFDFNPVIYNQSAPFYWYLEGGQHPLFLIRADDKAPDVCLETLLIQL